MIRFILLTFAITWGPWLSVILWMDGSIAPGSPGYLVYGLGGLLGPVVAAFITKRFYSPKQDYQQFLRELRRVKVNWRWYAVILLVPFVLGMLPYLLEWMSGGGFAFGFETPYFMILAMLPMMILGGGLEEVGWRGVLLPELLRKYSALSATLIVAVVWAVWHTPLWFIQGTVQYGSNFGWFALSILGSSLLLSVVYVKTRSILLCVLLHALFNANSAYFHTTAELNSWVEGGSVLIKLVLSVLVFMILVSKEQKQLSIATGGGVRERY
ncbi:CPBP family intramembrane glutamic endopeptidase [Fredinandcohnia humi]